MPKVWPLALNVLAWVALSACAHSIPGTHVELVDRGGSHVYVGGAAGPGVSQGVACDLAVQRAVQAIAERFAADQSDVAARVAKAVGVENGRVFLERYVHEAAGDATVHDVRFDPIDHFCLVTVNWTPPLFVEKAVLAYAHRLEAAEVGSSEGSAKRAAPGAGQAAAAPAAAAPSAATPPPPTPAASRAPVPSPPRAAPKSPCSKEAQQLHAALSASRRTQDDYNECLRRAGPQQCYDYRLYRDDAEAKQETAAQALAACRKAFGN